MQLPFELSRAIQEITDVFPPSALARAAAELTVAYRGQRRTRPHLDQIHRAAYLLTRLPATYAVLTCILRECKIRIPDLGLESMLDLGAGPSTAAWAAQLQFPELTRATLVEDNPEWITLGKRLAQSSEALAPHTADWRQQSITAELPSGTFDLVTISYALNEVRPAEVTQVLLAAWERTAKVLVVAEAGTPTGFELIREVRRELIASGAFLAAPCPHALACPMRDGNWCHFAERVQRTSEHRLAKNAELGYEDEKYSYVVFCRHSVQLPSARILRHPQKHSGHVELELCTEKGLIRETVSRKQGEDYKRARRAEWGNEF
jgi:ribosomal protein RSM22 (predicted rRNA methylase)